MFINNMSNETKTDIEEISKSVEKTDPMTETVLTLVKSQTDQISSQNAQIAELSKKLEELQKEKNENPVDKGVEVENKPAVSSEDVGDKVTATNLVAPKPSEAQADIIPPAVKEPGTDNGELSMENKADEEDKKEEKKEDIEKTDDSEYKEDKKEEVKKSEDIKKSDYTYKVVETVRPLLKSNIQSGEKPTAYQMLKGVADGFGVTSDASEALVLMYQKMESGEFGDGRPSYGGLI